MTTIYTNDRMINIPFNQERFEYYLEKINLKSEGNLDNNNVFLIIKNCYEDFKSGNLSLDDFSNIGGYLFNKLESSASRSSIFGGILLDIGELNFYVRNPDEKLNFSEPGETLARIDEYFSNLIETQNG